MEAARRASFAEEEAHQSRASQLAVGASISRTVETEGGTSDGAVVAEDTSNGFPTSEGAGSGKSDCQLVDHRRFVLHV